MNVTLNQIGEALWCSKGDFFWDLNFFFFFYFRIARTLLQSHYSHLHNFTFILAYSVKTCRLFSSYSSRRSSKENTHKAAAGTGIGRGSGYILFLWHETQNAKHSTFNLCLLPQWEHTVPRAPPPQRVTHAVTFMGWGISAVYIMISAHPCMLYEAVHYQ